MCITSLLIFSHFVLLLIMRINTRKNRRTSYRQLIDLCLIIKTKWKTTFSERRAQRGRKWNTKAIEKFPLLVLVVQWYEARMPTTTTTTTSLPCLSLSLSLARSLVSPSVSIVFQTQNRCCYWFSFHTHEVGEKEGWKRKGRTLMCQKCVSFHMFCLSQRRWANTLWTRPVNYRRRQ